MPELHLPWLEISILIPLLGAFWVRWIIGEGPSAFRHTVVFCALTFLCALGEWIDFTTLSTFEAHDHWGPIESIFHRDIFVVDELSSPLLPLAALIALVTVLSTTGDQLHDGFFARTLVSESILLATFSCRASWALIALFVAATIPPWLEMRRRGRCTRIYSLHMGLFVVLLVSGWGLAQRSYLPGEVPLLAASLLTAAVLLRSGIVPVHCWLTDLFEKVSFGTAILFVTPLTGAYAVMRLVYPISPDGALQSIAVISLFTAVYAAGMALVQREARRFFCYLLVSHASLVLVGLELATPVGLTGALCVWFSVGLSLTGFGLTLRSIEARIGRTSMADFHGLFKQMPTLAGFFLLTGLASIGFPATIGFVGMELLIEGAVEVYPLVGTTVVIAAAVNGIAALHAYFRIFTGRGRLSAVPLWMGTSERVAVLALTLPILFGGLLPQFQVASRYHAAIALTRQRQSNPISPIPAELVGDFVEENP